MAENRFSLLRLQPEAIGNVLKTMDTKDLIILSVCSKRMKRTVKSINFKIPQFEFRFSERSALELRLPEIVRILERAPRQPGHEANEHLLILSEGFSYPEFHGWAVIKLIDHICEISGKANLDILTIRMEGRWSALDFRRIVGNVTSIRIEQFYSALFYETLFTEFPLPSIKKLQIMLEPSLDAYLDRIGLQNFDLLSSTILHTQIMILEDLLACNAKCIQLRLSKLTDSSLNRFLRIWRKGGNPRLQSLQINFSWATLNEARILNETRILRGTESQEAPANREMRFEILNIEPENEEVTVIGGKDIRTKTGRVGTLVIDNTEFGTELGFYVWD